MNWFTKLFNFSKKSYGYGKTYQYDLRDRNYAIINSRQAFKEGYLKNVIVYRCVNLIAQACATLPIELIKKNADGSIENVDTHPMIDLIKNPNPWTMKSTFFNEVFINYLIAGEGYIERIKRLNNEEVLELIVLPSQTITWEQGQNMFFPKSYKFQADNSSQTKFFPVDQTTGESDLLSFKNYNPLQPIDGLSPLQPSAAPVDNHNQGLEWNATLLDNSAKPTGVLSTEQIFADEEFQRIKEHQAEHHEGAINAGKTRILEGGMTWMQTGLSPMDMDFKNSIEMAARNIGAAYNIPHQLIVKGESTYNNYEIAKESLYTDAVIPLMTRFLQELSRFVNKAYPDHFYVVNEDKIDALEPKRERRSNRISIMIKDGRITLNEAREMDGLERYTIPEADQPLISRSFVPLDDVSIDDALNNITPPSDGN